MTKKIFILPIIVCLSASGFSQMLIDTAFCYFDSSSNYYKLKVPINFSEIQNQSTSIFRFNGNSTNIEEESLYTDIVGINHHKFIQKKNGVRVLNSEVYIREANNLIIDATGLLNINIPTFASSYTKEDAINAVLNYTNCFKYKWQDNDYEGMIKEEKGDPNATFYPNPELSIIKTNNGEYAAASNYRYIYPICISGLYSESDSSYIDSIYYFDAVAGNILRSFSPKTNCFQHTEPKKQITNLEEAACHEDCRGGNPVLHYYGQQGILTEKFLHGGINCTHRLKDNCTGTYLYVKHFNSSATEVDFRDNANTWSGGGSPSEKVGATTLWCLEKTHEFYRNVLGRNSYNNMYGQMKILVADNPNNRTGWNMVTNYMEVAMFSGTQSYEATLDIMGHEVTHGVADQICFLMQDGDAGTLEEERALGEGYCDIFGQAIEYYVQNHYSTTGALNDYYQGSNIPVALTCKKQRSLSNPNLSCNPDTYLGTNWVAAYTPGSGNPDFEHTNSTIMGHWYYLLSEGGNSYNDNNQHYCVTAIGQDKAIQIAYLSLYYLGGTQKKYLDARNATIQAATSIYGFGSNEVAQVASAWYAVGVGSQFNGQINIQNITVNTQFDKHQNSKISVQNVTVNNGPFYVSSNTEIELLPDVNINSGTWAELYIAPACAGGARLANTNNENRDYTYNSSSSETENNLKHADVESINSELNVFPNPNNGEFKLTLNNSIELPKSIVIRDVLGREIKTVINPTTYEHVFDLKNMNEGLYMINVFYSDKTLSKRIIKN